MEILENRERWLKEFREGWLAHYQQTGEFDWKRYNRPTNHQIPGGPGIALDQSRLILITSAGSYLKDEQEPFEAEDPLGDYSLRLYSSSIDLDELAFSHTHYEHSAVEQDPQVLVPLRHLNQMVNNGLIGELAPTVISFMGYLPLATRLVDETIPAILEVARQERADAALLVPA